MKKMLKAAAVLAAILMAFTLGACDDGSSSGSSGGGGGSGSGGGGSSYLKIEGKKVTGIHLNKIPSDGKIVIPDGVEGLDSQWCCDIDAYQANPDDYVLPVDKVTSISLPASLKSFYSAIPSWWTNELPSDVVLDIDIIYRGTLADYCKIENAGFNLEQAKGIKVGDGDLKTLKALVIPDGATEIARSAFSRLPNIKSVTIPKSVKEIGDNAFDGYSFDGYIGCTIEAVTYKGTLKDWCDITNDSALLKTVSSIKMSDGKDLKTLTEITANDIAGATKIGDDAFNGCGRLESIEIPESVTEIGYYAFEGCTALTSVTFKDTKGWYRTEYKTEQGNYIDGRLIDVTTPTVNASLLRTASSSWCYAYLYKDKAAQ